MLKQVVDSTSRDLYAPVSVDYGFINPHIVTALPASYAAWDDLGAHLADNIATFRIRDILHRMPVLSADEGSLPYQFLLRASILLSGFAHAYYYPDGLNTEHPLPDSVMLPLTQVARRINKKFEVDGGDALYVGRTYLEDFLGNWKFSESNDVDISLEKIQINRLKLLVSYFNIQDDDVSSFVTGPLMQAKFVPVIKIMLALEAELDKSCPNQEEIIKHLISLQSIVSQVESVLSLMTPKLGRSTYVDQIIWPQTSPTIGKKAHVCEKPNTGADSPIFHIFDMLINRNKYDSQMGHNILDRFKAVPENYQRIIMQARVIGDRLFSFVASQNAASVVKREFANMVIKYAGPKGFLDRHRQKAYGYIIMSFLSGRLATNANVKGDASHSAQGETPPWDKLNLAWLKGLEERLEVLTRLGLTAPVLVSQKNIVPFEHHGQAFYPHQIALANKQKQKYAIFNGAVVDITSIAVTHPGGHRVINDVAGTDMTRAIEQAHIFDGAQIQAMVARHIVGYVTPLHLPVDIKGTVDFWTDIMFLASTIQNHIRNIWFFDRVRVDDADRFVPFQFVKKVAEIILGKSGYLAAFFDKVDNDLGHIYKNIRLKNLRDPRQRENSSPLPIVNLGQLAMELGIEEISKKNIQRLDGTYVNKLDIANFYLELVRLAIKFLDNLKERLSERLTAICADMYEASDDYVDLSHQYNRECLHIVEEELDKFRCAIDTPRMMQLLSPRLSMLSMRSLWQMSQSARARELMLVPFSIALHALSRTGAGSVVVPAVALFGAGILVMRNTGSFFARKKDSDPCAPLPCSPQMA